MVINALLKYREVSQPIFAGKEHMENFDSKWLITMKDIFKEVKSLKSFDELPSPKKSLVLDFGKEFDLNLNEALLFIVIFNEGLSLKGVGIADIAKIFGMEIVDTCSIFYPDLKALEDKGMIGAEHFRGRRRKVKMLEQNYVVPESILEALLKNQHKGNHDVDIFDTMDFMAKFIACWEDLENDSINRTQCYARVTELRNKFAGNSFVDKVVAYDLDILEEILVFYLSSNLLCGDSEISIKRFMEELYGDDTRGMLWSLTQLHNPNCKLKKKNLVKYSERRYRQSYEWKLSKEAIQNLLVDENLYYVIGEESDEMLVEPSTIKSCELYYNKDQSGELQFLHESLQASNYSGILDRLASKGLRKGINILFYGEPGTGKTEYAFQLAKDTSRAIFEVDISTLKSMWYGESQKIIKQLFEDYRKLITNKQPTPILLLNEADAILSRRVSNISQSVDQTSNAIQNIILEEFEKNEGIILACTNLVDNLDDAFERRFLFKIKFEQPDESVRYHIWKSRFPNLIEEELLFLGSEYDFNGAKIENICRKVEIHNILKNEAITLSGIESFCKEEKLVKISDIHFLN
jgi:DNA polymerase III delta prime subunit